MSSAVKKKNVFKTALNYCNKDFYVCITPGITVRVSVWNNASFSAPTGFLFLCKAYENLPNLVKVTFICIRKKTYGRFFLMFCENLSTQIQKLPLRQHLELQGINTVEFVLCSGQVSTSWSERIWLRAHVILSWDVWNFFFFSALFIVPFMLQLGSPLFSSNCL